MSALLLSAAPPFRADMLTLVALAGGVTASSVCAPACALLAIAVVPPSAHLLPGEWRPSGRTALHAGMGMCATWGCKLLVKCEVGTPIWGYVVMDVQASLEANWLVVLWGTSTLLLVITTGVSVLGKHVGVSTPEVELLLWDRQTVPVPLQALG